MKYRNKFVTDAGYRLLLWVGVGYTVLLIDTKLSGVAGEFLGRASKIRPANDWVEFLAMLRCSGQVKSDTG